MRKVSAIVPAAGSGKRFAAGENKVFLPLGGQPVLGHGIALLSRRREISEIIIAAARGEEETCGAIAATHAAGKPVKIVTGGKERLESVALALAEAKNPLVMVHDGARPLLDEALLDRLLSALMPDLEGVVPVLPLRDTVKRGDGQRVEATLERAELWAAQTPQLFYREALLSAYRAAKSTGYRATDDASLVEANGGKIAMVPGSEENIKITTPLDLEFARLIFDRRRNAEETRKNMRIGNGFDVHALGGEGPLRLGGVAIPHERGLVGHSDGDVLLHALIDAILGAMADGDIGVHFPPGDPAYRRIDSRLLLKKTGARMEERGFSLVNADAVVMAERPKLQPYILEMRREIAAVLHVPVSLISVKATTTEKLGFVGRGEGIAASAAVLLDQKETNQRG